MFDPGSGLGPVEVGAGLVFMSAALQRLVDVLDPFWCGWAKRWVAYKDKLPETDPEYEKTLAKRKARVILFCSWAAGTGISWAVIDPATLGKLGLSNQYGWLINLLFGLMISAGSEGTNNVVKLLAANKEVKAAEAKKV